MATYTGIEHLGAFTVFGLTHNPDYLIKHKLLDRLEIIPRMIDFGSAGLFFLYTSYGDIAETEEAITLKLGFVHTPARSPLSAQQLLERGLVGPQGIDQHAFCGNALVAGFSKVEARFAVFRALLSGRTLYYSVSNEGILCSDRLRFLVDLLDRLELDEAAVPDHFLVLGTHGSRTYFRNVQRLRPGECLKWGERGLKVELVKDFRALKANSMGNMDARSSLVYQRLKDIVGVYIRDIQESGSDFGNLLSGGVDSSVTQLLINEHLGAVQPKSFSYRVHAPSFEGEVEYAKQAQLEFNTEHTFIDVLPHDYPGFVIRATEVLGQPVCMAMEPCKLAISEFLATRPDSLRYFFDSQGADCIFGMSVAQKIRKLELAGRIPGAAFILSSVGRLLKPFTKRSQTLLKGAMILRDPNYLIAPINIITTTSHLHLALRCFGEQAVQRAFEVKRQQEVEYLDSDNYQEKVHLTVSLNGLLNITSECIQLFMAHDRELVYPFMDEDVIRVSFAIRPEQKYVRGRRVKPILKDILEQRSSSPAPRLPKLGSSFNPDVCIWMDSGPLHEMVRAIERPGFLSKSDFERLLEQPDYFFLWALLTFDVFSKSFLKR